MTTGAERAWSDPMSDAYERWLTPTVFAPFARVLAARVAAHGAQQVLELAAGTGALTRELVAAGIPSVTATDLNDSMVATGSALVPQATWRAADAMHLPYEDAAFDAVACAFGIMFFPDRAQALREARRVLRTAGVLVAATWAPIEQHAYAHALTLALQEVIGAAPPFLTTIPHGYHDEAQIRADLAAGGFTGVRIDTITLDGDAPSAADVARGFCTGTPLRAQLAAQHDVERVVADVAAHMEATLGRGPITAPMTALVIDASVVRG